MKTYTKFIMSIALLLIISGCNESALNSINDEVADASCDPAVSVCVTVGVYVLDDPGYVNTGKDLVYTVGAECESWTRTASAHDQYSTEHDHFNAHKGSTYVDGVFTWYEYGPEHDQPSIDATCASGVNGVDGVQKEVDAVNYTQYGNFYMKIDSVSP